MKLQNLLTSRLHKSNEIALFARSIEGQFSPLTVCYLSPINKAKAAIEQGFTLLGTTHQIESYLESGNREKNLLAFIFFGLPVEENPTLN